MTDTFTPAPKLRKHQQDLLDRLKRYDGEEHMIFFDQFPTGCGKTLVLNHYINGLKKINAELLEALEKSHKAIDILMTMVIQLDNSFMPTKSIIWPMIKSNHEVIKKAKGETL